MITCALFSGVNWWAVIAITIMSFALGSLWHSKLMFGKAWKEDAKPVFDPNKKASVIRLFGLSALYHFIAILGLAVFIGPNPYCVWVGLEKGFLVSLVFISTSIGVTYLFAGKSFRLFLIDAGFYVVFYSLAGLILGAW
jgi:hypothetical protein